MSAVETALRRLTQVMAKVGKPISENLRLGLSEEAITYQCQQFGVTLPQELADLYRYCDGMKPSLLYTSQMREYGLDGRYLLLPLDEALMEHERVKEDAAYDDELNANWFPFLREEGGDLYLVDATAREAKEPSIIWWMTEFPPLRRYSTLAAMFDTLTDAYEAGAYEDLYGLPYLNANLQMSLIASQRNTNVAYWQDRVQELSSAQS